MHLRVRCLTLALMSACASAPPPAALPPSVPSAALAALADAYWAELMRHSPTWATYLGDRSRDAELGSASAAEHDLHLKNLRTLRDGLAAVDRAALEPADAVTADVLAHELSATLTVDEVCQDWRWSVDQLGGPQVFFGELPSYHSVGNAAQGDGLIQRYRQMEGFFKDHVANLRGGLAAGYVAPRLNVERVVRQLDELLAATPDKSPFTSTVALPPELSAEARAAFRVRLDAVVAGPLHAGLRHYREFLSTEVLPKARDAVGISALPGGEACYAARIAAFTGLPLTPDEIHALGLREVERITAEMREVAKTIGGGAEDLPALLASLAASKSQYLTTADALLDHNRALVARAQAALPRAFGRLPKTPIQVKAIEAFRAKDAPAAYYYSAPADHSRPAYYYLNVHAPETRLLYKMPALAFHEAVPGHHLQIALANENGELPRFQREVGQTAFVEGWALYAEALAGELGLYETPEEKLGALSYEMWRAVRLVVDSGLHARGWSRTQAIDFMVANTGHRREETENEVDRYIIWPGQALAYKVGQLEIQKLRAQAEAALGPKFDLRAFHDRVLGRGAIPLTTLRREIAAFIHERQ